MKKKNLVIIIIVAFVAIIGIYVFTAYIFQKNTKAVTKTVPFKRNSKRVRAG